MGNDLEESGCINLTNAISKLKNLETIYINL